MKNLGFALAFIISNGVHARSQIMPHLDLEMTSEEYQAHLEKMPVNKALVPDPSIEFTLKIGTRLSNWIAKVNANRAPENAIRLTSAATRIGIPIDKPNAYSPEIIKTKTSEALATMANSMKTVITSQAELPTTIPVSDQDFIKSARLLNKQYQSAARYKSLNQWRSEYIAQARYDVRGFYYLMSNKIKASHLKDPAKICFNATTSSIEKCKESVENAHKAQTLDEVFTKYYSKAKKVWTDFFIIPSDGRRSDVSWSGNKATVPFNTPNIPKFIPYLQDNIEDEFKFANWRLKINFGAFINGPLLIFKPGVVPHVNKLGGNEIVMDSNQPIEEYESQWTIRHEFGHVLGLPDCYHEFYDTTLKAYVNYQLDITDLMCSRAGNMNERIFKELKKV